MTAQPLGIAVIGAGMAGKAHANAYRQAGSLYSSTLPPLRLVSICDLNGQLAEDAAARFGYERHDTDWRAIVDDPEIHVVSVVVANFLHREIVEALLAAGKHVLCEKPLANSQAEAEAMADAAAAAAAAGVHAMVGFTYRRVPAVTLMRDLIAQGLIGPVRQVRAAYRQDWLVDPQAPLVWRLQKEHAGSGALGDIGAHIVDMTQFVTGQTVTAVSGMLETIVKERPLLAEASGLTGTAGEGMGEVTVDDLAVFTGRLSDGAIATFEATRFATGRKNALTLEVSGEDGALVFDLEDLNVLEHYDRTAPAERQGFTRILVTEDVHPYVSAWWPAGHMLGYEHGFTHQVVDLVQAIDSGVPAHGTFAEGLSVQRVLEAVGASAANGSTWASVPGND